MPIVPDSGQVFYRTPYQLPPCPQDVTSPGPYDEMAFQTLQAIEEAKRRQELAERQEHANRLF